MSNNYKEYASKEYVGTAINEAIESGDFGGNGGIYVGDGEAPEGTKVQIDANGDGSEFTIPDVLQTTGNSEVDTMSQKAITEAINAISDSLGENSTRVIREITLTEPVAYMFIPFTDFKDCTAIYLQAYIPTIKEEDYSLGYYRPRLKIATASNWYSGVVLAGQQIFNADAVKTKYNAVLYSDDTDVYVSNANQRLQYGSNVLGVGTSGDSGKASLTNVFNNANAGVYFEIEDRTKYQVPAGTVLTVIGV